jgi:hypothetical protein
MTWNALLKHAVFLCTEQAFTLEFKITVCIYRSNNPEHNLQEVRQKITRIFFLVNITLWQLDFNLLHCNYLIKTILHTYLIVDLQYFQTNLPPWYKSVELESVNKVCWGDYLDLRGRRKYCITRSFIICTRRWILLGWPNQRGWNHEALKIWED